jgi:hypothetical protein
MEEDVNFKIILFFGFKFIKSPEFNIQGFFVLVLTIE